MAGSATIGTLRAVLEADSSKFTAAMAEASKTASLFSRDFTKLGATAEQVGQAFTIGIARSLENVNRLAKEFSGAGMAAKADELAAAIDRIGGASKLTASEQASVNAQVTETLAKYKALGVEAPAHLQKLAAATKQVSAESLNFTAIWGKIQVAAGALGIGLGASAAVGFVTDTIKSARAINDLATKLGVSTEKVQQWDFALSQTGGTQDQLNTSLSFMNKTLGEGSKGTIDLLASMGLNFRTLRAQKPEATFEQIVDKIAAMQDPLEQSKAAVLLFGKAGQDMLPSIREGFLDIAHSAATMSDETIKALDRAGDEWDRFYKRIKVTAGTFIGAIAAAQNRAADVTRIQASDLQRYKEGKGVPVRSFQDISAYSDERLAAEIQALNALEAADKKFAAAHAATGATVAGTAKQFEYATTAQMASVKVTTSLTSQLSDVQKAVANLTAEKRKEIEAGLTLHLTEDKIAEKVGISEEAVKLYAKAFDEATQKAKDHDQAVKNLNSSASQLSKQTQDRIIALVAQGKSEHDIALVLGVQEQQVKDLVTVYHDWQQVTKEGITDQAGLDQALQRLTNSTFKQALADRDALRAKQQALADASSHDEIQGLVAIDKLQKDTTARNIKGTADEYAFKKQAILDWGAQQKAAFTGASKDAAAFGKAVDDNVTAQIQDLGMTASQEILKSFESLPATLSRAFEGGGGVGGAFKSFGFQIGGILGDNISKGVTGAMTPTGGKPGFGANLLGSLAGGFSSMGIGFAISGISALISHFQQAGRDMIVKFGDSFGGLDALHQKLLAINNDTAGLWNELMAGGLHSNDKNQAQKAIDDVTAALQKAKDDAAQAAADAKAQEASNLTALGFPDQAALQKTADGLRKTYDEAVRSGKYTTDQLATAWKHVQDATNAALGITASDYKTLIALGDEYGLTLQDMGKDVQFGNFSDQVSKLIGDYKTLTGAGADHVFANFEGKFQDLFTQAQKFQVAIPEALRPFLQQMVNLGDLVDTTGAKVTDLSTTAFAPAADDAAQLAENQAALAKATTDVAQSAGSAVDVFTANGGLNDALAEAARLAGDLGGVLSAWSEPSTSANRVGITLADMPVMSVTSPGVVAVTPGDLIGKPELTPGFGAMAGARGPAPVTFNINTLDASSFTSWLRNGGGRAILEHIRTNDGGGASVGPLSHFQQIVRSVQR